MIGLRKKNIKGFTISEGHCYLYLPEHPSAKPNKYYAEHRFIMEQQIGRFLKKEEIVHHKNGNGLDNRIKNLEILTANEHAKHHYCSEKMIAGRRIKYKNGWNPNISGSKNPNWKGGKIKRKCNNKNCDSIWFVFPSLYDHKKYCSRICHKYF